MLKAEMDRLTSEMNDAETAMQAAARSVTDLEGMLDVALLIAGECERHYAKAEPRVRRMLNQGLFGGPGSSRSSEAVERPDCQLRLPRSTNPVWCARSTLPGTLFMTAFW
jgi:hypothetical protein